MVQSSIFSLSACALLLAGGTSAFVPSTGRISSTRRLSQAAAASSLSMTKIDGPSDEDGRTDDEMGKGIGSPLDELRRKKGNTKKKNFAATAVASAYLLAGLVGGAGIAVPDTAMAYDSTTLHPSSAVGASTVLLSARSGGRMGGRSGGGGYRGGGIGGGYRGGGGGGAAAFRSRTTIVRPTVVTPMPMVAPPPIMFGSPFGFGFGSPFGYGIGSGIREYRQESELQRSRAELEMYKQREAEMERRLEVLEQQQQMQGISGAAPALQPLQGAEGGAPSGGEDAGEAAAVKQ